MFRPGRAPFHHPPEPIVTVAVDGGFGATTPVVVDQHEGLLRVGMSHSLYWASGRPWYITSTARRDRNPLGASGPGTPRCRGHRTQRGRFQRRQRWGRGRGDRPTARQNRFRPFVRGVESHEILGVVGAEAVATAEGNMCGAVTQGTVALPGSEATSRMSGSRRNPGDLTPPAIATAIPSHDRKSRRRSCWRRREELDR
jgi:hypothetical protein